MFNKFIFYFSIVKIHNINHLLMYSLFFSYKLIKYNTSIFSCQINSNIFYCTISHNMILFNKIIQWISVHLKGNNRITAYILWFSYIFTYFIYIFCIFHISILCIFSKISVGLILFLPNYYSSIQNI